VEEEETVVRLNCVREESIFSTKKKKEERKERKEKKRKEKKRKEKKRKEKKTSTNQAKESRSPPT